MTAFNTVIAGQQKIWALLLSYVSQNRIPQALMFVGKKGLGKHSLGLQFAHALLCPQPQTTGFSCGVCSSCLLLKANTHPDLILVNPGEDKSSISINQIRQVVTDAYLKPQFDSYRVVLINPADAMTTAAANAFLKCLEEPTERTIFVLISDKPSKLPATIRSRCQQIAFAIPEQEYVQAWLTGQGIQANQSLIRLVQRSILTLPQINDDALLKQRSDCFKDWMALAKQQSHPALISEKWQKLQETELLSWLLSWLTDLIKAKLCSTSEQLCNLDLAKSTQELAQLVRLNDLYKLYDRLLDSRRLLGTPINFQLMIEEILVQWQELNGRPS